MAMEVELLSPESLFNWLYLMCNIPVMHTVKSYSSSLAVQMPRLVISCKLVRKTQIAQRCVLAQALRFLLCLLLNLSLVQTQTKFHFCSSGSFSAFHPVAISWLQKLQESACF